MVRLPIENPFFNAPIYFIEETETTMDDAARLATRGEPSGTVVVASAQSKGRGRYREREWFSGPGESLLFTMFVEVCDLQSPVSLLPLVCGLGLAISVERITGGNCLIKWPNDGLVNQKKVAGILCIAKGPLVYIGIGLNCNQTGFPEFDGVPPTSLMLEIGYGIEPVEVLNKILMDLKKVIMEESDPIGGVNTRLAAKGRLATILLGTPDRAEELRCRIDSVGPEGQLFISDAETGASRAVFSGEVVRCRYDQI